MRFRVDLVASALVVLAALACRKGTSESTQAEPAADEAPVAASAEEAPAPAPSVLTVEDFEEEALRLINADTIDAELELVEQEIRKK